MNTLFACCDSVDKENIQPKKKKKNTQEAAPLCYLIAKSICYKHISFCFIVKTFIVPKEHLILLHSQDILTHACALIIVALAACSGSLSYWITRQ